MKKIAILVLVANIFLINFIYAKEPSLGVATVGYSCEPKEDKQKETEYIGIVDVDGFLFITTFDHELYEFHLPFTTTPISLGDVKDVDYSLSEVYIWYIFLPQPDSKGKKPYRGWFHNLFYYDNEEKQYFYIRSSLRLDKKFEKKAIKFIEIGDMQLTGNLTEEIVKKMQKDYKKINKWFFGELSPYLYGSPVDASRLMHLKQASNTGVFVCKEVG